MNGNQLKGRSSGGIHLLFGMTLEFLPYVDISKGPQATCSVELFVKGTFGGVSSF